MSKKSFESTNVSGIMQAVYDLTGTVAYDTVVALFAGYHNSASIDVIHALGEDESVVLFSRVSKKDAPKIFKDPVDVVAQELTALVAPFGATMEYKAPVGNNRNHALTIRLPIKVDDVAGDGQEQKPAAEPAQEKTTEESVAAVAVEAAAKDPVERINNALDGAVEVITSVARECAEEIKMEAQTTVANAEKSLAEAIAQSVKQAAQEAPKPMTNDQAAAIQAMAIAQAQAAMAKPKASYFEMSTPVKIGVGIVAAAAVGAAGYYGYQYFKNRAGVPTAA